MPNGQHRPAPSTLAAPSRRGDIVYVGDVTEARGAAFLIDVVARLPGPHRLRLIGRCATQLQRRLKALAAERQVRLDLPGFVSHDEAMRAVVSAGVGVCPLEDLPNYRHSQPTKIVEYLALGVPVVASDLPGTVDLVDSCPGVQLVAPRDTGAWAEALGQALTDPVLRTAAVTGAAAVRERFTWPADQLLDTYRHLSQPPHRPPDHALVG